MVTASFYYELENWLSYVHLDIEVKNSKTEHLEVEINPTKNKHNPEYMHEGLMFGFKYTYERYLESRKTQKKGLKIIANLSYYNAGITHDVCGYVSALLLSTIIGFDLKSSVPFFSTKRNRFIFPKVERFPVYQMTQNEVNTVFRHLNLEQRDNVIKLIKIQENEYFNR